MAYILVALVACKNGNKIEEREVYIEVYAENK